MEKGILIKTMDPVLIKIYEIKDIEEIGFSDMAPSTRGDRFTVLPLLFIRYDGGKFFSMSSKDKYFDVFVKKVFQVYNLEKDRVVVDPQFDPFGHNAKLQIDNRTRTILESGNLIKVNEIYSFYDRKKSYDRSLLFQSDELRMLLPMVKYHLKQIFDWTDRVITLDDNYVNGYRNNYSIGYKMDGIDDILVISFVRQSDDEVCLYIRSVNKMFKPLEMHIAFNKDNIDVSTNFEEYKLFSNNCYQAKKDNTVVNTFRVYKDGQPIIYTNLAMDKVDNPLPNIAALDSSDDVMWYQLPWNGYYGVNNASEGLSEIDEVDMMHNKYLALIGDEFMMREYASKEYQRRQTFEANANRVIMDDVHKRVYGILLNRSEGIYVIETFFGNVLRSNGYYDAYLEDKYFYHLAQNKDLLLGLGKSDLISISSDDNIIRSADLLAIDDVRKLVWR